MDGFTIMIRNTNPDVFNLGSLFMLTRSVDFPDNSHSRERPYSSLIFMVDPCRTPDVPE